MSVVTFSNTAQVFVTTYAIGNKKDFTVGKWFDLSDFADKEDFLESAMEFAINELGDNNPELCFSDYDNIPSELIGESDFDDRLFEFLELSDNDKEIVQAYMGLGCNLDESLNNALENYFGYFETVTDLGVHIAYELMRLDDSNPFVNYINFEQIGVSYECNYLTGFNGHYFWA